MDTKGDIKEQANIIYAFRDSRSKKIPYLTIQYSVWLKKYLIRYFTIYFTDHWSTLLVLWFVLALGERVFCSGLKRVLLRLLYEGKHSNPTTWNHD